MNIQLILGALYAPVNGDKKNILIYLASKAEPGHSGCTTTPAEIAKVVGCSLRTVSRAIDALIGDKLVVLKSDNEYRLTIPDAPKDALTNCQKEPLTNCPTSLTNCPKPLTNCPKKPTENPPQKSASLPPTPPITSNNIFITPPILDSTQTKENISRVEDNNNRTTSDNIYTTDKVATPDNVKPTAEDSSLTLEARQDAFRKEAISELIQKGFTESDAASRVNAVWDEFIKTASNVKKNGFKGINQKRPYFIGMLVNKAVEGPKKKKQPEQPEPKDLYDIIDFIKSQTLDECKEKFGKLGAFEEADVRNIFDTDMLARQRHNIWLRLLEKQELGWYGETSAVACVRKMLGLDHLVRQVMAKIDAERYADAKRKIAKMEMRLPSLEKQVEGLTRPKDNEPGSGYILSFFRDLEKYRRELPRLREFVANWEAQHNK